MPFQSTILLVDHFTKKPVGYLWLYGDFLIPVLLVPFS
jgi:hypothetical protein